MCNIWQRPTAGELSLEQIKRFLENYNAFSWINLSGGEIFLREDLLDIIQVLFQKCKHLYLLDFPTNGFQTKLIVDVVKKILTLCCPKKLLITVSMDGPCALHEQIRNVPGSWSKAVETFKQLRLLRASNFNVFFGMTLQPSNMDRFEETFRSIDEQIGKLQYEDFHMNLIQCSRHYYGNLDNVGYVNKQELWEQMDKIIKLRKVSFFNPVGFLEKRYQHLAKIYLDKNITPIPCQAMAASFFMDSTGNVYPCSIYDREIGNITDYDYNIYKLWELDSRRKLREDIRQGKCPQCWTPCEAYQSILANLLPKFSRG
jgi:MoaA/NifB/PqqE/SkfB family radical SAM enzyme